MVNVFWFTALALFLVPSVALAQSKTLCTWGGGTPTHNHCMTVKGFDFFEVHNLTMTDRPGKPYPTIWFKAGGEYIAHINAHKVSKAGTLHDHLEIYTRCGPLNRDADGGTDCPRLGIDAGHDVAPVFVTEDALLRIRHARGISIKGEDGKYYRLRIKAGGEIYTTPDTYFPKAGTSATWEMAE